MSPSLDALIAASPSLHALARDEAISELQIEAHGAVWARRAGQREAAAVALSPDDARALIDAARAALLADSPPGLAALEGPVWRWLLLSEPVRRGPPALFGLRVGLPRLPLDEWLARGWARRAHLDALTDALRGNKGALLVGPPGGPQGRLLASILGALPGAPLAVLLEPRLGLDVDGLPLTCLRRDLVAAGPQRALCEDLIARADWLAAHDLDGPDDWRWVTAPGPQPRLLSMTADSPQDAARALVQRALEAREGATTLQLPQDLNVALVVLCKPTEQGAALELFTFPDRPLSATGALFLRPLSLLSAARPAAPSPAPEATPAPPPVVEPPPPPVVAAPAPPPVVEPPVPPLAVEAPTLTPTPPAPPLQAVAAPAPTPPEAPARPPRHRTLPDLPPATLAAPLEVELEGSTLRVELDIADLVERPTHNNLHPVTLDDVAEPPTPDPAPTPIPMSSWSQDSDEHTAIPDLTTEYVDLSDVDAPVEPTADLPSGERPKLRAGSLPGAARLGGAMAGRVIQRGPAAAPAPPAAVTPTPPPATDSPPTGEPAQQRHVASARRLSRFGNAAIDRQASFKPAEPEKRAGGLRSFGRADDGFEVQVGGAANGPSGADPGAFPDDEVDTIQKPAAALRASFAREAGPEEATIQKSAAELAQGQPLILGDEDSTRELPASGRRKRDTTPLNPVSPRRRLDE